VTPEDADYAIAKLKPLSTAALFETLTAAAWRTTPSTNVVCEQDRAIPPAAQEQMAEASANADPALADSTITLERKLELTIELPENESLLIRTDFCDDDMWRVVCDAACVPNLDGYRAYLGFIDDRRLDGATVEALLAVVDNSYFFVADSRTIADPEHPILVVNNEEPFEDDDPEFTVPRGATFRVIPSCTWEPENNLSIANMDFAEFADSTDDDGVFRGFR
jgi:hypothetical protein